MHIPEKTAELRAGRGSVSVANALGGAIIVGRMTQLGVN